MQLQQYEIMHLCNNSLNTYQLCMTTSVMISRYQLIGNLICGIVLSGIYTSYILSICNVAVKKCSSKQGNHHIPHNALPTSNNTPPFLLSILFNPCKNFSHLKNLIPTLHSYHRTKSFWCNRKATIMTELLPPSYLPL